MQARNIRGSALSPSPRPSSADASAAPRVQLPADLSTSLRYLEDAELQRLRRAVEAEIDRRQASTSTGRADQPAAPTSPREAPSGRKSASGVEIPEGKANLIRASFHAGLKPGAIARTFGVSLSLVNRLIRATEKPQR